MRLDKRIESIISNIDKCKVLADVGCDHGKVAVYVAKNKLAQKVIASDISEKSLSKAKMLASENNLLDIIDIRVGCGTKVLKDNECDTLVIAGMGGLTICDILADDNRKYNRMVLSPQGDVENVRDYLSRHGLCPIKDYKVSCKNKFYDILVVENGDYNPSEAELLYGSGKGYDFNLFYNYESSRLNYIINNADKEKSCYAKHCMNLLDNMIKVNNDN